jgi:hypothetical protein
VPPAPPLCTVSPKRSFTSAFPRPGGVLQRDQKAARMRRVVAVIAAGPGVDVYDPVRARRPSGEHDRCHRRRWWRKSQPVSFSPLSLINSWLSLLRMTAQRPCANGKDLPSKKIPRLARDSMSRPLPLKSPHWYSLRLKCTRRSTRSPLRLNPRMPSTNTFAGSAACMTSDCEKFKAILPPAPRAVMSANRRFDSIETMGQNRFVRSGGRT